MTHDQSGPATGVWVVAGLDALAGVSLLPLIATTRPVAGGDGLSGFSWLMFLLGTIGAALLFAVTVCLAARREGALWLAADLQRWAAWAFFVQGAAMIGLSFVIVNESMRGTASFLNGLFSLVPASLCLWGSRYLFSVAQGAR